MAQAIQTTLRPLHDRVLVERLVEGDDKRGSIFIPDSAKEKPQEGKLIAVGAGIVSDESDRILFGEYTGSEVQLDGETSSS